jgi:hypothetical protein
MEKRDLLTGQVRFHDTDFGGLSLWQTGVARQKHDKAQGNRRSSTTVDDILVVVVCPS